MKPFGSISFKSKTTVESKVDSRRKPRHGNKISKATSAKFDQDFKVLVAKEKEIKDKISKREEKHFKEVSELKNCIRELEEILQPYRGLKVPDESLKLSDTLPKTIRRIYDYHDQIDKEDREYLDKMIKEIKLK